MIDYIHQRISCPHCGHLTSVELDASQGDQVFYEDCKACCHPIHLRLYRDEVHDRLRLFVEGDDNEQWC
ncbi:CPXCG motif-containing cysteine-rich protein [Aeromonas cavernicola]|uniref:CPXCG motif-containing cysteine-rich protein n=1 Tax=Aeromonas cavernicola TaxID=1006623 RepID=A0A2H9U2Z7_9GAMM|nr:CPXCG motif-containing cysteine-rich protein [Aeromonas cavernicola]PJG58384.1 CPXCG motif-containing cysteine-rich protein [Aeromonas cavernicola]